MTSYGTTPDEDEPFFGSSSGYQERSGSYDERLAKEQSNNVWKGRTWGLASAVLLGLLGMFAYVSSGLSDLSSPGMNLAASPKASTMGSEAAKASLRKASAMKQRESVMGSDGRVIRMATSDSEKYGFTAKDIFEAKMKGADEEKLWKYFLEFASLEKKDYAGLPKENKALQAKYDVFISNVMKTHEKNLAAIKSGKGATYGINRYADITAEEKKALLSYNADGKEERMARLQKMGMNVTNRTPLKYMGDSTDVDWTGTLATTYILDQGFCGACWAVTATEQLETDSIAAGITSIDDWFSAEYLLDCDTFDQGCLGGNPELAWLWLWEKSGMVLATDYGDGSVMQSAYTDASSSAGECQDPSGDAVATPIGYYTLSTEEEMKDYVQSTGPISICYAAQDILDYSSGIITECSGVPDHCSQIVGFTDNGTDRYFTVRNSWSDKWGTGGYFFLEYGSDLCSITYEANHLLVEAP